ncbi:MAG: alpha-L-rhamnosidase C-terminal domain-containing protein, partial [Ginsengibacter sp.]
PIYLLGKYYLGISPTSTGYATYKIQPSLGGLKWMEGTVPTPHGKIQLRCDQTTIKIKASEGIGTLRLKSKTVPKGNNIKLKKLDNDLYEINIQPNVDYTITYKAI